MIAVSNTEKHQPVFDNVWNEVSVAVRKSPVYNELRAQATGNGLMFIVEEATSTIRYQIHGQLFKYDFS
jgi:hypothetical protein